MPVHDRPVHSLHRLVSTGVRGALPLLLLAPFAASAQSGADVARDYRESHEVEILRDFAELLSYPNSARDLDDITRAAEYIRDELIEVGVPSRLLTLEGVPPIVFGHIDVGAPRTLGIYVHYDGQPVDPSNWTNDPFDPSLYSGAIPAVGERIDLPEPGQAVDPEWRLYA